MYATSRLVTSSQIAPHPRLDEIVARHLREPYRREPSTVGRTAFATIVDRLAPADGGFILDAGCGTGESTLALARLHAGRLVVGVDKSAARLAVGERRLREAGAPRNAILLRCDLVDFWQLAAAAGLRCEAQYLLYPNPWPKPEHLMRRWHAHPVLPAILALGGEIEMRTNWPVYAREFARALNAAGRAVETKILAVERPLSAFERKYAAAAQTLWHCLA